MKKGNRTVRVIAGAVSLTLLLGGCTIAEKDDPTEDLQSAAMQSEEELYQAKIAYYQGQMQLLEAQLAEMDERIMQLQSEYLSETDKLQEELQTLRENETDQPKDALKEGTAPQPKPENENVPAENTENTSAPIDEQTPKATHAYTYEETEDGVILTKYLGTDTFVEIPAAVDGKKVVALGDRIFSNTDVESVAIPPTVQRLGWFTFFGCSALKEVDIPASVTNIGYASFDGCHKELVLHVDENTYAHKYAASFALRYEFS